MGLAWSVFVKISKINRSSGAAIVFGGDAHAVEPGGGCVGRDLLQYPKPAVPVKSLFHTKLQVDGNQGRDMDCDRLSLQVNMEFDGRAALHEG